MNGIVILLIKLAKATPTTPKNLINTRLNNVFTNNSNNDSLPKVLILP